MRVKIIKLAIEFFSVSAYLLFIHDIYLIIDKENMK